VVERALAREIRRQIAARDAEILAAAGPAGPAGDADLDALAEYAAATPADLD
jgi:hypothetical protein